MATRAYEELIADDKVQALIAQAREQYPGKRFRPVDTAAGVLVLMNPSRAQHDAILKALAGNKDDESLNLAAAATQLQTVCAVPDKATINKLIEEWPGLPTDMGVQRAYQILAGQTIGDYQK